MLQKLITLGLVLACLPAGPLTAAPPAVQSVHTNKSSFRIPYRYDAEEIARLQAREIRLYASIDGGQRWQLMQSVAPNAQKFEFTAPRDGEYWFAVRTLDSRNQLHPPGDTLEAGLKIVVDTAQPVLKLNLRQSEPGRVELSWNAIDAHIDPSKLALEYVQAGGKEWQAIRVLPEESGNTSWSVPNGGIVAVRGSIKDLAGNLATAQMQLTVDPANATVPQPTSPDFRKPVAEAPLRSEPNLAQKFPGLDEEFTPQPPGIFPGQQTPIRPRTHEVADRSSNRPTELQGRYQPEPDAPAKPSGAVKIVSSTDFGLGYQLQDVGPSGVASVELFITQDDGAHWWRYGEDEDRTSPFDVNVPIEGVYGFALRVKSGAGLAIEPPQNGDKPEMSVVVDQTPPEIKLLGIQPMTGPQGAQVVIKWRLNEANPNPAPVSVSYANTADGPWIPITGWQPDEGEFAWRVSPQIPPHVFVKIEARDAAGNTSAVMSEKAIAIDLSRPSARIVDVESENGSGFRQ